MRVVKVPIADVFLLSVALWDFLFTYFMIGEWEIRGRAYNERLIQVGRPYRFPA
ncbi:hypothetical protein ACFL2Q_04130 [Thermodesulfobacteriota bacterium]